MTLKKHLDRIFRKPAPKADVAPNGMVNVGETSIMQLNTRHDMRRDDLLHLLLNIGGEMTMKERQTVHFDIAKELKKIDFAFGVLYGLTVVMDECAYMPQVITDRKFLRHILNIIDAIIEEHLPHARISPEEAQQKLEAFAHSSGLCDAIAKAVQENLGPSTTVKVMMRGGEESAELKKKDSIH